MTQPDDTGTTGGKTFTQAEVDAIVRDRLKREREATATKYGDYDDLKRAAAEGDKNKSQLEKLSEQIGELTSRAEKAEAASTRAKVVAAKKLPPGLAKRLQGKTEEELTADADELLADWKAAGGKVDDGDGKAEQDGDNGRATPPARPAAGSGRPREDLRSGAPTTPRAAEETNPLKLAALVPRN